MALPPSPGTFMAHSGFIHAITEDASPGLRFLKLYISTIDTLDQTVVSPPLAKFLTGDCTFVTNGSEPTPAIQIQSMLGKRAEMLSEFSHAKFPVRAFDLEGQDGKRTVVCEAVSVSTFKDDPKQEPAKVNEMLVLELSPTSSPETYGLNATLVKTYMDPSPVQNKVREVMAARNG